MISSPVLQRTFRWLNLPTGLLVAFLQRAPAVRAADIPDSSGSPPLGEVARGAEAAAADLGAIHALAGATQLVPSAGSPTSIIVTVGTPVTVVYTVSGTQNNTQSWTITGAFPPGLNFSGLTANGTVNTTLLLLSGTPTTAGAYPLVITSWQYPGGAGNSSNHAYTVAVVPAAATAPSILNQPLSQNVALGDTATLTVDVSGNPAPKLQWRKGGVAIDNATNGTLTLANVQASDAATYTVVATNSAGSVTSNGAVLTVTTTSLPSIISQPQGHAVATGSAVVFGVEAAGGGLSYQWKKNGATITGATDRQFLVSNAQPSDAGGYSVTVTNPSGAVSSNSADLTVAASADPGRLINVSVRIVSGTDANALIMGFVAGGAGTSGSKSLLIRGVGPTLGDFGVPGFMLDPILQIIPQGTTIPVMSDDNWAGDTTIMNTANAVGAFALPSATSKDAALVTSLAAGVYSAKVLGNSNTTGTVLAEIYDANPRTYAATTPRLINISARATMANDNPLIAGFVIGGSTARTVMIRAIGPALIPYGVTGAMPDPLLELIRSGTTIPIFSNDNWGGSALITSTGNSVGAFALTDPAGKDAVLLVTLDPGVYSAKVTGVGNGSGITLVEIYEIP